MLHLINVKIVEHKITSEHQNFVALKAKLKKG
jgi:hypothetical protein